MASCFFDGDAAVEEDDEEEEADEDDEEDDEEDEDDEEEVEEEEDEEEEADEVEEEEEDDDDDEVELDAVVAVIEADAESEVDVLVAADMVVMNQGAETEWLTGMQKGRRKRKGKQESPEQALQG